MSPAIITLLILLATIIAFMSGKIPMSVVSMGIIVALLLFKILPPKIAFSGFINTNVVMFVAMFVIGAGITKTSILDRISQLVYKYRDNQRMFLLITCIAAVLLATLTSATATMAILIPLIIGIVDKLGMSRSKILFPVAIVANISAASTFLGIGSANMAWSSVMMKMGGHTPIHLMDFTWTRLPFLLIALLYCVFVAPKLLPDRGLVGSATTKNSDKKGNDSQPKLSPFKEKLAMVIIGITIIMMILSDTFKLPIYLIAIVGALLLVICGILTEKEALGSINLPTIFLFGGVLVLSDALNKTGAGKIIAQLIIHLIGHSTNTLWIMFICFAVPFIFTQFMSNLATVAIFVPLVCSTCLQLGIDPRGAILAVVTASVCAILTPLGTPSLTMIFEPADYNIIDYIKAGTPLALILMVLSPFVFALM